MARMQFDAVSDPAFLTGPGRALSAAGPFPTTRRWRKPDHRRGPGV